MISLNFILGTAGGISQWNTRFEGLFPFNDDCYKDSSQRNNLYFGMRLDVDFYMTDDGKTINKQTGKEEEMIFSFSGDDDVWVFIDNDLILDMGGPANIVAEGYINFAKNQTYVNQIENRDETTQKDVYVNNVFGTSTLSKGKHTLKIFYLERFGGGSNFKARFNLPNEEEISTINVKYVDKNNNQELGSEVKQGVVGKSITTQSKTFSDYTLVQKPSNETVTFTKEPQTVTYYYAKNTHVTVKYLEKDSNQVLHDPVTKTGYEGMNYTTDKLSINNYTYVEDTKNTSGKMKRDPITVIYYYLQNALLEVKHIDKYTNKELDTETKNGLVGQSVNTSSKTIDGYTLIQKPNVENYTFTKNKQTVYYYYAKNTNVTVKYLEKNSNQVLKSPKIIDGYEGKKYSTEEEQINNYTCVENTGNTSGVMARNGTTVIYYYLQNTSLEINHIDKYRGTILSTEEKKGLVGQKVNTSSKEIDGYTLVQKPSTESYTLAKNKQIVNYYYAKNTHIIVEYLDKANNKKLRDNIRIDGYEGKKYSTDRLEFTNYELVEIPKNSSDIMPRSGGTVTYLYLYKSKIRINHIDKSTGKILEIEEKNGLETEKVQTSAKDIPNYKLVEKPNKEEYTFTKNVQEVNYYYSHISQGVLIKHIDINTNELLDNELLEGYEGDSYSSSAKEFKNYTLVKEKMPQNAKGLFSKDLIEVKYYYIYNTPVVERHIYGKNGGIEEKTEIKKEGSTYTINPKTNPVGKDNKKYKLDEKRIPENATGTVGKDKIIIEYYYIPEAQAIINYIDKVTNEKISNSETIKGWEGDPYESKLKEIKDYVLIEIPNNSNGHLTEETININYYYLKKSKVIVNYIDITNNEKLKTETIEGLETKEYKTEPNEFENYVLIDNKLPTNRNGKFSRQTIEVNYYYIFKSKLITKYLDQETNEEIDKTESNGFEGDKIKTTEKDIPYYKLVEKPKNENYVLNKETQEVEYFYRKLAFNLKVEELIEKIYINGDCKYINGNLGKLEVPRNKLENDLKVYYKIKVTNNSEIDGNTELIFNIPTGFVANLEENKNWSINGNVATIKVENININETKEFTIILTNTNKKIFGTIKSNVIIKDSNNKAGYSETTLEDNKDNADFIMSIKSGIDSYYNLILYEVLGLLTIGAIIICIKKYKNKVL